MARLEKLDVVRGSFIPSAEFQELRALTRHRETLIQEATRIKNRVQKVLEDANIRLSSVINDVFGVGGYAVLKAIAAGITGGKELAKELTTNIKNRKDLEKGLRNTLKDNHVFIIKQLLEQYEFLQKQIGDLSNEIAARLKNHEDILVRLDEIPGISRRNAENILAEASANMEAFKTEKHFAAWAGVAPGNNESANKKKELE